jgi:hypothetical protein
MAGMIRQQQHILYFSLKGLKAWCVSSTPWDIVDFGGVAIEACGPRRSQTAAVME